jgi:hypothetical protein
VFLASRERRQRPVPGHPVADQWLAGGHRLATRHAPAKRAKRKPGPGHNRYEAAAYPASPPASPGRHVVVTTHAHTPHGEPLSS